MGDIIHLQTRLSAMARLIILTTLLSCLALTQAHLCLINPTQRGSMNGLNTKGSDDCLRLKSPCGGMNPPKDPQVLYRAGSNIAVTFQKNLDHFISTSQGKDDMKELARVPDTSDPSLSLYSVPITLPKEAKPWYTLQVVYMTKNDKAPPAFYQCADISLA